MGQTDIPTSRTRRAGKADVVAVQPTIADWVHRIRAEYLEMPGLYLTTTEIQRMWGLDGVMCDALLDTLVAVGFLKRTRTGGFVRADSGSR